MFFNIILIIGVVINTAILGANIAVLFIYDDQVRCRAIPLNEMQLASKFQSHLLAWINGICAILSFIDLAYRISNPT